MKNNRQYLGIDIGGTFIKIGVVSENGEVAMRCEVPIVRDGSETVMETLFRGLDSFMREHGLDAADYEGIGVSSAGCIDSASGCIAKNGGNVPGWSHTEVTGPLTERYGLAATIANDGNCVALAEAWTGAAKGSDNVVCVVLGGAVALAAPLFPQVYNTTDEVRTLAASFLRIASLCMPIAAFMNSCYFTLRSGGKTVITFLFDSVFLWCVSTPAAYVLSRYTTLPVVPLYFSVQMLDLIKCGIGFVLVKKGVWLNNIVGKEPE